MDRINDFIYLTMRGSKPGQNMSKIRQHLKPALLIYSIMLFVWKGTQICASEMLEYSGYISITSGNGTNITSRCISFKSIVLENMWSITTKNCVTNVDGSVKYQIVSYDGTNSYWYAQLSDKDTNSANTSLGSIVECKTPPMLGQCDALLPWLATASHTYFDVEEPGVAKDIWTLLDPEAVKNKNKVVMRRHEKPPHLPEYIEFYTDGILRGIEIQTQKVIRRPYPEPYNQGFITRIYYATNFMLISGRSVPKVFELHAIRININNIFLNNMMHTNDARQTNSIFEIYEVARGEIQSIRTLDVNTDEFIPRTDGKTYTTDGRVAIPDVLPNGIAYINTNKNGSWLPKESKFISTVLEHELKARGLSKSHPSISGGKKRIILVLMTLAALLPLYLCHRHFARK